MNGLMREYWGRKGTGIPEKLAEPVLYPTLLVPKFLIGNKALFKEPRGMSTALRHWAQKSNGAALLQAYEDPDR